MPFYLSLKEIWRSKWRFLAISMVIALITTLVLFIAALAEGLGAGNKEYIENLNADLVLYQENVDLSIPSSRIGRSELNDIRRVDGVRDAGPIGFSSVTLLDDNLDEPLGVSMIGVEPGRPGEPPVFEGENLRSSRSRDAIIDNGIALRTDLQVGDPVIIKSIQGTEEEFFELTVVGISESQQYSIQPALIVPFLVWDDLKPQAAPGTSDLAANIVGVQLNDPATIDIMAQQLELQVGGVEAATIREAYENTPGYSAQQSTLSTQRYFTLLIGILVIGGFFQIQMLQKVGQIGMLKAIGTPNLVIATTVMLQITLVTVFGVALGAVGTILLSLSFPPGIPIVLTPDAMALAVTSLLVIGPLGGLVSVRLALRVEPLTALGLGS